MRKDKDKCKNKHETTIGKIIYGFLLFLPLFAIGVTCGYAIFNKNAYQSYSGKVENYEEIKYSDLSNLPINNTYNLSIIKFNGQVNNTNSKVLTYTRNDFVDRIKTLYPQYETQINNSNKINFGFKQGYNYNYAINLFNSNNQNTLTITLNELPSNFDYSNMFIYITNIEALAGFNSNVIDFAELTYVAPIYNDKVDNVFYYSIDKVQESPLFNWAENSVIYTGMNNFTTALSITTPFIPLLMTYWLIISIVYFLYDIVLIILVVLHKKIHALEESI